MTVRLLMVRPNLQSWDAQCVFNGPTISHSGTKGTNINVMLLTPIKARFGDSINGIQTISSCVSHLFRTAGPITVFWTIIPFIIPSFNRQSFWAFPHISQKVCEILPSLTDFNTSCTISLISRNIRTFTSCFHHMPSLIKRVFRKPVFDFRSMSIHSCHGDRCNGSLQGEGKLL